ncbi:MAG: molybdopterin-dependent oxidoreductase [Pseudomonadota bacterium]
MALVKLEIDGKRVIADSNQTILAVARENGIRGIPTLCNDDQLEPFSSCFVCVVKVKGARTLIPACSTKVTGGMVVETDGPDVRKSRKAALELMLSNHYADCVGPCQLACPAEIDIQGYLALAALGKYEDAIRLIKEDNPLPAICGRVCTRPCEVRGCRRTLLDEPVGIDYIKRYLADMDLGRKEPFKMAAPPPNGKKVAIVGGGPAGLSCAHYLALRGYAAHIFEALPEAGGMLRYGIPEYRLPKEILDLEISQILDLGVLLSTNVSLGKDFTIASLKEQGFGAIFLAIGAWQSSEMRVQNENLPGVLSGIEFLKAFGLRKKPEVHGKVLVVGGGNTAIDCARTALRLGAKEVRIVYRRTKNEMPANAVEIEEAEHEGVQIDLLVAPQKVIEKNGKVAALECLRMELGEPDASGRRSPKPVRGSEFEIPCDFVIAAIGQATTVSDFLGGGVANFLPFGETLNLTRWKTVAVNEGTFETSVEGVFSGGDVVTGAATAIEAIAAGRKTAHAIDRYLTTGKAEAEPQEFNSRRDLFRKITKEDLRAGSRYARRQMAVLPVEERISSFAEVEQGYTPEDVVREAHRCLECGCLALFHCRLREYATEYDAEVKSFMGEAKEYKLDGTHPLIELDPNKCILCSRCVRVCGEVVGAHAYGLINRGFSTVVKPTLGGSLLDTDCVSCGLCLSTCPTGAIVEKISLSKPGPWKTEPKETVCHYCGVGCTYDYDVFGNSLVKVSRVEGPKNTFGNHCKRGRFGYSYVQAPDRLKSPKIRAGRELQDIPFEGALDYAAMRFKELLRKYNGGQIALFVSPRMTNEEIYLAQKFARVALRTHNVSTFGNLVNREFACPEVVSTGSYPDLLDAQAIVVVNSDTAEEHFVTDLLVKRAVRQGTHLIYIGPEENRVSRFADVFIPCEDGTQTEWVRRLEATIAGKGEKKSPEIQAAAEIWKKAVIKVVVFNKDYRGLRVPGDERIFAETAKAMGATLLALREKSNAQGLSDMGANPATLPGYLSSTDRAVTDELEKEWCVVLHDLEKPSPDLAEALAQKKIRVAVVLGEDPLGSPTLPAEVKEGLRSVEFLVVGDLFMTETAGSAHLVLPLSATAETSGTMTNQERRVQGLTRAVRPVTGMESWEILREIAGRMGYRFKMKYGAVSDVTEEIRKTVPIYRNVKIGSQDSDGLWDLSAFPLPEGRSDTHTRKPVRPTPTRPLDNLESRFDRWFEKIFADAEAARKEGVAPNGHPRLVQIESAPQRREATAEQV